MLTASISILDEVSHVGLSGKVSAVGNFDLASRDTAITFEFLAKRMFSVPAAAQPRPNNGCRFVMWLNSLNDEVASSKLKDKKLKNA